LYPSYLRGKDRKVMAQGHPRQKPKTLNEKQTKRQKD
jgi:hypothetical protein